jgi:hypothetical protein
VIVLIFSKIDDREVIYLCLFAFSFSDNVLILLFSMLTFVFAIERKIASVGDACSRPPITIRFHDLHADNIREAMGFLSSGFLP